MPYTTEDETKPENRFQNLVEWVEDNREELEFNTYTGNIGRAVSRKATAILVHYNRLKRELTPENLTALETAIEEYIDMTIGEE